MATAFVRGPGSLAAARLALGAGEAPGYPASAKVVSNWFPRHERGFANSIWDSGARVGTALTLPVVAFLIASYNWRVAFVVTGALGLVWVFVWVKLYREPRQHPKITEAELEYITAGGARLDDADPSEQPVRWRDLFRYRTVWGMMLGFFCLAYVIYFFITWFPSYLVQERGFDLLKLGIYGALPGIFAIGGSLLGGFTSDWLVRRGWSINRARKTCLVGGLLCSSVVALAVFVPSAWSALALLSFSYSSLAFAGASLACLPADVAPRAGQVSSLAGIQNFASNIAGFSGSFITGLLVSVSGSYVVPLIVSGAIAVVGALCFGVVIRRVEPLGIR